MHLKPSTHISEVKQSASAGATRTRSRVRWCVRRCVRRCVFSENSETNARADWRLPTLELVASSC